MEPRYRIWVRCVDGVSFVAFDWCRDEASGIRRAQQEAPAFGFELLECWAEEI